MARAIEVVGKSKQNIHFGVTAGHCDLDDGNDVIQVQFDSCPLGSARQDNQGDPPVLQVLLVADSVVRGEQEIKACFLCRFQQRAVV